MKSKAILGHRKTPGEVIRSNEKESSYAVPLVKKKTVSVGLGHRHQMSVALASLQVKGQ